MSRSTFRDVADDVAWQRQLRDQYSSEGAPSVPHLDLKRAMVRSVSRRLAEQIILRYEWLGTMAQSDLHYGIFFGSYCAGVCCVATASTTGGTNIHKPFGIERRALRVLARGACVHWSPPGANSKLVAWTCKLVARDDPSAKILIAYSDTDAGEIGTIYQACNWVCIGQGAATTQYVAPTGRVYDQKLPSDLARDHGGQRRRYHDALLNNGWRVQHANPKYRYVWLLDRADRALCERVDGMRQPYPKRLRPASVASDTASAQEAIGGATPTAGLHNTRQDTDARVSAGA